MSLHGNCSRQKRAREPWHRGRHLPPVRRACDGQCPPWSSPIPCLGIFLGAEEASDLALGQLFELRFEAGTRLGSD